MVQWYPALRTIAEQNGWRLLVIDKDGCRLTKDGSSDTCKSWNDSVVDVIDSYDPDGVITLGTIMTPGEREYVDRAMLEQVREISDKGVPVIGIRGTPKFEFAVPDCLATYGFEASECALKRIGVFDDKVESSIAETSKLKLVDMTDSICGQEICEAVVGNVIVYRDDGHLTQSYSNTLAMPLEKKLREAMPELF